VLIAGAAWDTLGLPIAANNSEDPCVLFLGQYEHSFDDKGRIAIPKAIRDAWDVERDGQAWCAVPWVGGIIRLYTEKAFQARAGIGQPSLTPDPDEAELRATLFGLSSRIEPDAAGRIRVPEEMRRLTGLGGEVVLVGAGDWLEIRDRTQWSQSKQQRLQALPEVMARLEQRRRDGRRSAGSAPSDSCA